jgi:hypothetical protein
LPELVPDRIHMKTMQNIKISFIQKLWANMLISRFIECSTSLMPHRRTFMNFTDRALAIWDLSINDMLWIIRDPGSQKMITLCLECIYTIPFQAGSSDVKIPKWGQHCSNRGMTCLISISGTFQEKWNQPKETPCRLCRGPPDIFSNITNREIQRPDILITWSIGQVSLVGCKNDWCNRPSCRKLILCIPPSGTGVYLAVYSATFRIFVGHQFKIEMCLKWVMCQKELNTFENISVIYCSEDMRMIFNPTNIAEPKIDFREELSQSICRLKWFDIEVVQSTR